MSVLFVVLIILLCAAIGVGIGFIPDLMIRYQFTEQKKEEAKLLKAEEIAAAKAFPIWPTKYNRFNEGQDLSDRLKKIFDTTDDESVKDAARLIYNNQLLPAVAWAEKDASQYNKHIGLIEPLVKNLEIGLKAKTTIELNTFTAYLEAVNEGVVHMPSELDLSGIDFKKIRAAYKPKAIDSKPVLTREEKEELSHYEKVIANARKESERCAAGGYDLLVARAQRIVNDYEKKAVPLRKKAGN